MLLEIYESCLSTSIHLQAKVGSPSLMGQVKNNEAKVWQYGHEIWNLKDYFVCICVEEDSDSGEHETIKHYKANSCIRRRGLNRLKTWFIKWSDLHVFYYNNTTENQFWPKGQKNFFESGGFAMGRSGYLKHEYYFPPPNNFHQKTFGSISVSVCHAQCKLSDGVYFCSIVNIFKQLTMGRTLFSK